MSRHEVDKTEEARKWVFGWDQPLMSFYLQVHHLDAPEDHPDRILILGADKDTMMHNLDDLVREARKHDLVLPSQVRAQLYAEKIDGR